MKEYKKATKNIRIRTGPAKKYKHVGTIKAGKVITVCEKKGSWYKFKKKGKFYYCHSKYFTKATNYGALVANEVAPLAEYIVKHKAKHESGNYEYKKSKVNCSVFVSKCLQNAKVLNHNVTVYHTSKNHKKHSIGDCVHNRSKVKHYKWVKTNSKWENLSKKYKKPGCVYIYESSVGIMGKDKHIYGCHSSGKTYKKLSMIKHSKGDYEYKSPILVVGKPIIE